MFNGARLKIGRANQHIADLEIAFHTFVKDNPHTIRSSRDPKTGRTIVRVHFDQPIPDTLALIIGDAIHNLRTALDHATWELIGLDGGTQDRYLKFPTGDNRINYEASCKGLKTPREDTKKFFIALAAYKGGAGNILYTLNLLDNADKHTVLTPTVSVCSIPSARIVSGGNVMGTFTNCSFGVGANDGSVMMNLGPGCVFEIDEEPKPAITIFFCDIQFMELEAVIPALVHFRDAVTDTIGQFEGFVAARQ
jgi:hypothetical protein